MESEAEPPAFAYNPLKAKSYPGEAIAAGAELCTLETQHGVIPWYALQSPKQV